MQREKDELEGTVRRLEERLREVNRAEKPLEETEEGEGQGELGGGGDGGKALRNAEEVAR